MKTKTPEDIRFTVKNSISKLLFEHSKMAKDEFYRTTEDMMRLNLANHVKRIKVETDYNNTYIEQRLDVYVASPAEFWDVVNAEAMRIAERLVMDAAVRDILVRER